MMDHNYNEDEEEDSLTEPKDPLTQDVRLLLLLEGQVGREENLKDLLPRVSVEKVEKKNDCSKIILSCTEMRRSRVNP